MRAWLMMLLVGLTAVTRGEPAPDRDKDRIPDAQDKCPDQPETYNGVDDEDGCPDEGPVVRYSHTLKIPDRVFFAAGKRTIDPEAVPLLDALAARLKDIPEIATVEVVGHAADNERDPTGLSAARAAAVHDALVARGTEESRLVVRSAGKTRPVCAEHKEACRRQNRTVDFKILSVH